MCHSYNIVTISECAIESIVDIVACVIEAIVGIVACAIYRSNATEQLTQTTVVADNTCSA